MIGAFRIGPLCTLLLFAPASCGPATSPGIVVDEEDLRCPNDAPIETWETFGQGFLLAQCQGCHASSTPERFGAPEEVVFDTREDAIFYKDRILARAAGTDPTMPPNGGSSDEDRERLRLWLTCHESP